MPNDLRTKIETMKQKNVPTSQIIENLKKEGHSSQEIYDSIANTESIPAPDLEAPSPNDDISSEEMQESTITKTTTPPVTEEETPQQIPQRQNIEQIEEIAESIVSEKWQEIGSTIGTLNIWKEKITAEIEATKQEILRLRNQYENLQAAMLGKVEEYQKNISEIGSEMKALTKVFEKIIQPLTTNIKELSKITEKLKRK